MKRACELELIARQMDTPPVVIDDHVVQRAAERMRSLCDTATYGLMERDGMVRTVERASADSQKVPGLRLPLSPRAGRAGRGCRA
jgi:hypothetical protein